MQQDVLFEITKAQLETGMRGFPVGYCTTSHVDAQKGLFYIAKPLSELAHQEPRQVIYLLYHGKEGSAKEIEAFFVDLQKRAACSEGAIKHIQALPREG